MVDGSVVKLTSNSNFVLLSSFQVKFERIVNGIGGQKSHQRSILTWSMGMWENLYSRLDRRE